MRVWRQTTANEVRQFCTVFLVTIYIFCLVRRRVDTTDRLALLRAEMKKLGLNAFLVPSGDSHQSEYVAKTDRRRQWIGGFSGSSGFAAITLDKAAMWADGR